MLYHSYINHMMPWSKGRFRTDDTYELLCFFETTAISILCIILAPDYITTKDHRWNTSYK